MAKQSITIAVDIPEGFEATGEFRLLRKGDWFINACGNLEQSEVNSVENWRIILRRKAPLAIQACRALIESMSPGDCDYRQACNLASHAIREYEASNP